MLAPSISRFKRAVLHSPVPIKKEGVVGDGGRNATFEIACSLSWFLLHRGKGYRPNLAVISV